MIDARITQNFPIDFAFSTSVGRNAMRYDNRTKRQPRANDEPKIFRTFYALAKELTIQIQAFPKD